MQCAGIGASFLPEPMRRTAQAQLAAWRSAQGV